jgi:hypothetical protein
VTTYLTEIVVVANDRKKLLADCSEIVSDIAFILKTGSATTNEHATLEFLVRVSDLDHLQRLMDSLRAVPSVMSVERKVSCAFSLINRNCSSMSITICWVINVKVLTMILSEFLLVVVISLDLTYSASNLERA